MKYYELEIAFNESNYESIYNTLYLYEIKSILEENGVLKISLPEKELKILEAIKNHLISDKIVHEKNIIISKIENLDWNKEWEKTIQPISIKNKLIIYPSWKKNELGNTNEKILIEIDPKMSFGTGHNETTQLILELMCDYITSLDKKMLDFGCGTGILTIAGIKLGLKKAISIDIDEDSIENAKENFKINSVDNNVDLYKNDITEIRENGFDIICANITSGVIRFNLKQIHDKLKPGGKLFITGILISEKPEIEASLIKNGFEITENRDKAEWTGYYIFKKS